jgi:hypothetical protein
LEGNSGHEPLILVGVSLQSGLQAVCLH